MKNKFNNFIHNKTFTVILILLLMSVVSIAGTYAWFTWSSTENTSLTMTIGKFADVMFSSGNAITTKLIPVFNYYDGEKTTFSINNRDTSGTSIKYIVKLNITTIPSELRSKSVKYALVKDGELVTTGDLSTAYDNYSINVYSGVAPSGITSYTFYLYIDGNIENNSSMMNKTIVGNITVEAMEPTSYNDFRYYLGSEYSTVSMLENYYDNYNDETYNLPITTIELEEIAIELEDNEILLYNYIGESKDVYVPDTYTIDNISYDVILLSEVYLYQYGGGIDHEFGALSYNNYIESVYFGDGVRFIAIDENTSKEIQNNSADGLFTMCTSLVNVPEIPSTVTSLNNTFLLCTSLVNAPKIPNTVTEMVYTFVGCESLTSVSEIPSSVTDMQSTFAECPSLTGTVRINSSNVSIASDIFDDTIKPITVEVPSGSVTHTTINETTVPSNVTIKTFDAS